ncbi:MAG: type II toxin-antitoxin system VapC family toxin [bacterium]
MTFFDTNILIYQAINQDLKKQKKATSYIDQSIDNNQFFISPLVLSEFIFVLAKLKIIDEQKEKIELYRKFASQNIDIQSVSDAYRLCIENQNCKNINDFIHLKTAEKYCKRLITFDNDFKKLQTLTNIKVEILGE